MTDALFTAHHRQTLIEERDYAATNPPRIFAGGNRMVVEAIDAALAEIDRLQHTQEVLKKSRDIVLEELARRGPMEMALKARPPVPPHAETCGWRQNGRCTCEVAVIERYLGVAP